MKSLLIGEVAAPDVVRRIEAEIERGPEVRRVIRVLTQHLGPDELLVAATVEFDPALTVGELVGAINACEVRLRAASAPTRLIVYVEPDVRQATVSATAGSADPAPAARK